MGRPRIVEVNYFDFKKHLRQATDVGGRIEKSQKDQWKAYLKEHKINEVAMMHWGKSRFAEVKGVILDCGNDWDGFYCYSEMEEAVLKWTREE